MKKRGQLELLILVGLIIVIGGTIYIGSTIAKSSSSIEVITGNYIGDIDNNLVFDITKCNINNLDNYVIFNSLADAHSLGFGDMPNCV